MIMMTQASVNSDGSILWEIIAVWFLSFAIIDSEARQIIAFFFLPPPPCVVAQKISLEMSRGIWVFLKMAFLVSSKQRGSLSPHVHLNWLALWLRAYSTCLPPARLLYPVDHWLLHVLPLLSPSSGSSCGGTGALIDWQPSPRDASIIIISTLAEGVGGLCPGGLADSPCFVSPIVN